jgi:Inorganic H+ pyrophosphatase
MNSIWVVIFAGLLSIVYGVVTSSKLLAADAGSPKMQQIAGAIAEGAQAYLKRQYATIAVVGLAIFAAFGFLVSWLLAAGFLIGAILSGAAGFIGMNVSVRANVRTAQAAMQSLAAGLDISFKAGAVTGLLVAGLRKALPSRLVRTPRESRCTRSARPGQATRRPCSQTRKDGIWFSRGLPFSIFSGMALKNGSPLLARVSSLFCAHQPQTWCCWARPVWRI